MPILRVDPAPPVDLTLVDWSFKKRFAPPPPLSLPQQPTRPQPSAEPAPAAAQAAPSRAAAPSTALVVVAALNRSVGEGALTLHDSSQVLAAHRAFEAKTAKLTSSTAEEQLAFRQSFNAARPAQLFANVNAQAAAAAAASSKKSSGADAAAAPEKDADVAGAPPPIAKPQSTFQPTAEVEAERDHLGRGFLHYSAAAPHPPRGPRGAVPTRLLHAFKGHTAAVQLIELIPNTAHVMLSADLSGVVMLWDVLGHKRRLATYRGHEGGVLSATFAGDERKFSTAGLDGRVHEWDTETGAVLSTLRLKDDSVVKSHVYSPRSPHSIIAGAGKRIVQWDTRVSPLRTVREYEAHTAPVMHVGFLRGGHHFASSSEDKTFRTWDIDSSVTVQDFADAAMHAVPHFACQPDSGVIAAQSLDNRVNFFAPVKAPGKFKMLKDKHCGGHAVSGSSCRVSFSPDGQFVSSGDVNGELHVWNADTCETVKKFKAHSKALNCHLWHPHAPWLITSGWDGAIKLFAS